MEGFGFHPSFRFTCCGKGRTTRAVPVQSPRVMAKTTDAIKTSRMLISSPRNGASCNWIVNVFRFNFLAMGRFEDGGQRADLLILPSSVLLPSVFRPPSSIFDKAKGQQE
jgi:hypothetical protein